MSAIRRRLASGALALTVLQLALLFTGPISACCVRLVGPAAVGATAEQIECCPAGSHPAGTCPLHKKTKTAAGAVRTGADCRMMCDAPHGPQFLIGAIGVLPAPAAARISLASFALPAGATFLTSARPSIPDAPPPRLL
jgi:hypothetical protein